MYNNTNTNAAAPNHTKRDAMMGAGAGGLVGHERGNGHTGRDALAGGVAGDMVGHHQKHRNANAAAAGPGTTGMTPATAVPPVGAAGVSTSNAHPNSQNPGSLNTIGKFEQAAGTVLCSSTLKAKGLQKEQEARALRMQGGELSHAEALEQEAKVRRGRAVGHGAHPDHGALGGPQAGVGGGAMGGGMGPGATGAGPGMNQPQY